MPGTVKFKVNIADLGERYESLRALLEQNIEITAPDEFLNGQVGTDLPITDVGVFLKLPEGVWYVWSDSLNQYVQQSGTNEIGAIQDFAKSIVDTTKWLECDGRSIPRIGTYAALFAVIGTTYGNGDGSTTFTIPDCRGKTKIGRGTGQMPNGSDPPINLTARNLGDQVGEESHALIAAELPAIDGTSTSKVVGTGTDKGYSATAGGVHNNMSPSIAFITCIRFA